MKKKPDTATPPASDEDYYRMLIQKREQVVSGMGVKFDTMA